MFSFLPITNFNLGPFTIYAWGLFQSIALIAAFFLTKKEFKKINIQKEQLYFLSILIIFFALIGSRLFYVFFNLSYFLDQPLKIFRADQGGLVFYGGFIGFFMAVLVWMKKIKATRQLTLLKILDLLTPAIFLVIFIGRIGCFLINDHIGAPTNLPWAINLDGIPRHPVALYLSLNGFVGFFILTFLQKTKKKFINSVLKKDGMLFLIGLLYYSLTRFFLDFTRVNSGAEADFHFLNLTVSQWISGVVFVGVGWFLVRRKKIKNKDSCPALAGKKLR